MADRNEEQLAPAEGTSDEAHDIAPPVSAWAGLSRRELIAIGIALLGGGTVTFALMAGSGASKPAASHLDGSVAGHPSAVVAEASIQGPRWRHANREWLASARRGVAFELYADNKVPVWQRKAHPILVVRCQDHRTEAFVFIESAAKIEPQDGRHTVTLGFDDEPELSERWPDSEEHDALFAPDGTSFARRLARANTLRFGYTPHNAAPVVATFSSAGLADLITPAVRQCGLDRETRR